MPDEIGQPEPVPEQEQKPKRVMTPEHKAKLKEARIRALAARKGKKSIKDIILDPDPPPPPVSPEIHVPKKELKFFGDGDRVKEGPNAGKISSEYPAYYNPSQVAELEDNISNMERRIARGLVPTSELPFATGAIKREKEKLERIRQSETETKGHEDILNKCQKEMGQEITRAMYNRSDGEKGLADPHEVADRWIRPCINIPPEYRELAVKANIPMTTDGKVNQVGAEKLWKLCRRALGDSTNTEILRRG